MKAKRILHLTLHRRWFDEIATGAKKHEYRRKTPYWDRRLCPNGEIKEFDEIHFRNGYNLKAPWMRVEWCGLNYSHRKDADLYAIVLGSVLEIKSWPGPAVEWKK